MNPIRVRSIELGNRQRPMISMSRPGAENPVQHEITM